MDIGRISTGRIYNFRAEKEGSTNGVRVQASRVRKWALLRITRYCLDFLVTDEYVMQDTEGNREDLQENERFEKWDMENYFPS